jgi:branched-chain amino acid transport system permease protein
VESNPYNLGLSNLIAIYAIVVLGLNLFIGYAGQISLGHAAFFAIGAYGSAIGTTTLGWTGLAGDDCGGHCSAADRPGGGAAGLKLSGHYLAMATLGFNIVIYTILVQWDAVTGGPSGFAGIPYLAIGPVVFDNEIHFHYLVWTFADACPCCVSQSGPQRRGTGPGSPGRG